MRLPVTQAAALTVAVLAASGCGASSSRSRTTTTSTSRTTTARTRPRLAALHRVASSTLPAARSGIAATTFDRSAYVIGGLDAARVSTTTVFQVRAGRGASQSGQLPGAVHDAAAAAIHGHLLLFGGGVSEGSDRIVQVLPGPPRLVGTLPQALSDLVAVPAGRVAYVTGGWNGTDTNATIYAVDASGHVTRAARLPLGVRYPAAGALDGRIIVAGGETTAGTPTAKVWSYDPRAGRVAALPPLPAPTDHTAGAALDGSFYVLGGLRRGQFTRAILAWRPGESHWRAAGRLPAPLADLGAVPFAGGILALGGRGPGGTVATATLLRTLAAPGP